MQANSPDIETREIDKAIESLNKEINDPENSSDHSLLKEKLDDLELLEGEYLDLLEEKETLLK